MDLARALLVAMGAAREAGRTVAAAIGTKHRVRQKSGPSDLVTEVDVEVEVAVSQVLRAAFPDYGLVAEEGHPAAADPERPCWIVDPLDGTTNFVHGVPVVGVSIALARGDEVLLGVVADAGRGELFTAVRGKGAYVHQARPLTLEGLEPAPARRRLAAAQPRRLEESLVAVGIPGSGPARTAALAGLVALAGRCRNVRVLGSAALELAYVAAGRLSGFWHLTLAPWDTAAGSLLVREAGGVVTTGAGDPFSLESKTVLASAGPDLHRALLDLLRQDA